MWGLEHEAELKAAELGAHCRGIRRRGWRCGGCRGWARTSASSPRWRGGRGRVGAELATADLRPVRWHNQPMGKEKTAREEAPELTGSRSRRLDIAAFFVLVLIMLFVILRPGLIFSSVQRTIIFLIVGVMTAMAIGNQAVATMKIKLGWLVATYGGTAAVVVGLLWFLTSLSRPEVQVSVFHIITPDGSPYALEDGSVVEIETTKVGITPTSCTSRNTLIVLFPEQVEKVNLGIRYPPISGERYVGRITYTGTDGGTLIIGKDLINQRSSR